MKDNPLEKMETDESTKAFAVVLARYISNNPDFLFELDNRRPIQIEGESWSKIHDGFDDDGRIRFQKTLNEIANSYDWRPIESVFCGWGKFGWITDNRIGKLGFWDILPISQEAADQKVLSEIDEAYFLELRNELKERTSNAPMFEEAVFCFDNECYFACASLLTSFIDGVLTASPSNFTSKNKKTGEGASKKILTELEKDDMLGLPGYFNLELLNFNSFISTFFARANGFENEPSNLNRNYLHHGMSNRRITREDCIKLFIAYRKTLDIAKHDTLEG